VIRFILGQYKFGRRMGFGSRGALTRALMLYRRGF
jgi:hypothetical protein